MLRGSLSVCGAAALSVLTTFFSLETAQTKKVDVLAVMVEKHESRMLI
jgi:hypothetical protein